MPREFSFLKGLKKNSYIKTEHGTVEADYTYLYSQLDHTSLADELNCTKVELDDMSKKLSGV